VFAFAMVAQRSFQGLRENGLAFRRYYPFVLSSPNPEAMNKPIFRDAVIDIEAWLSLCLPNSSNLHRARYRYSWENRQIDVASMPVLALIEGAADNLPETPKIVFVPNDASAVDVAADFPDRDLSSKSLQYGIIADPVGDGELKGNLLAARCPAMQPEPEFFLVLRPGPLYWFSLRLVDIGNRYVGEQTPQVHQQGDWGKAEDRKMADVTSLEQAQNLVGEIGAKHLGLHLQVCRVAVLVVHALDLDLDWPALRRRAMRQDGRHAIIERIVSHVVV